MRCSPLPGLRVSAQRSCKYTSKSPSRPHKTLLPSGLVWKDFKSVAPCGFRPENIGVPPIRGHNFDNLPCKPHVRVHTWLFITWKIPVVQLLVLLLLLQELLFCCYHYYLSLIISLLLLILLKLLAQHGVDFQVSYHCKETLWE